MMTQPPNSSTSGPLCKVCKRPMRLHTFKEQEKCLEEGKKRGIDLC